MRGISHPKAALFILLPALVILLEAVPQLHFLLPSAHDTQTESYEPAKTLQFVSARGNSVHKWGPMPCFLFLPAYAVVLAESKTYHLSQIDFTDPVLMSPLILAGRIVVLIVTLLALVTLTWTLARNLDEARVGLVVLACMSTSLIVLEPITDTKPDGLMNALLIISLAFYATIVMRGLTLIRAMGMVLFYVASLSCKELTSTSMFLPFAGLASGAFMGWRRGLPEGKRNLRIAIAAFLGMLGFYCIFNVVCAPHAWLERTRIVFGPLKDPAVWASPKQTPMSYLGDTATVAGAVLGLGGLGVLAITAVGTLRRPSARLLALWLPFISHLVFTTVLAGYMPPYFMLPLAPMLCLPASEVVARWLKSRHAKASQEAFAVAAVAIVCLYLGLDALALFRETHKGTLMERALYQAVPKGSKVNLLGLYRADRNDPTPGPNGTEIDPSPASELASEPRSKLPDYVLVDFALELWIAEIPLKPAYAALLRSETAYDYRKFPALQSLGYSLVSTIAPRYSKWQKPRLILGSQWYTWNSVKVFRLRR